MNEIIIQAPGRTVTVEEGASDSDEEIYQQEMHLCEMGWESVHQGSLDANIADSAGWIGRSHLASTMALKHEILESATRICVEMAIEEGILTTHPGNPSRLKPWEDERIELEAGGRIEISHIKDTSEDSESNSELAELFS